jgi:hypothetical protein
MVTMHILCTSEHAASLVRAALVLHGISRVSQHGPFTHPDRVKEIWVMVNEAIDPTVEPTIRRDVESIAGASIPG